MVRRDAFDDPADGEADDGAGDRIDDGVNGAADNEVQRDDWKRLKMAEKFATANRPVRKFGWRVKERANRDVNRGLDWFVYSFGRRAS